MEMFQMCRRQNNVCLHFLCHYFLLFMVTAHICLEMYYMPHGGKRISSLLLQDRKCPWLNIVLNTCKLGVKPHSQVKSSPPISELQAWSIGDEQIKCMQEGKTLIYRQRLDKGIYCSPGALEPPNILRSPSRFVKMSAPSFMLPNSKIMFITWIQSGLRWIQSYNPAMYSLLW